MAKRIHYVVFRTEKLIFDVTSARIYFGVPSVLSLKIALTRNNYLAFLAKQKQ